MDLFGTAGTWNYITRGMWDADKYLGDKETGEPFGHYVDILGREIEAPGNLTLVCASLIGKIGEVNAVSGATFAEAYKDGICGNYDIWG